MDHAVPPPVVCTLTTRELATRRLELADLATLALTRQEIPGGLRTTYPVANAAAIDDLVGREDLCCGSWLDLRLTVDHQVTLEATTSNPEGVELLRSMFGTG